MSVKRPRRRGRPSKSKATPAVLKAISSRGPIGLNRVVKRQKQVSRCHGSEDSDTSTALEPQPEVKLRRSARIKDLIARVNQESLHTGTVPRKFAKGPQPEHHIGHQGQSAGASKKQAPASCSRKLQNRKVVSSIAAPQQTKVAVTEAKARGVTKKRARKGRRKAAIGKLN